MPYNIGDNTPPCFTPLDARKLKDFSFSHDTHIDRSYITIHTISQVPSNRMYPLTA